MTGHAGKLGYRSRGYLSEVESGKKQPSVDLVLGVSRLFGVTTDELLKDEVDVQIR
ncbi:MAG TPA: helix-turn-helix transcriptional regulator [Rhodothermales bacterium]|nr:helix-turn-helix transcriptional regulator [Rhodothermales bacterium]